MADKSFGVKQVNLINASGTPRIESPNNLNINAVNVAISTDISVGGQLSLGTGTSISSPATNVLALGTNSVERLRITSSGNVGIGTDNPTTEFEVLGGGTVANFKGTGGSSSIGMQDVDDGTLGFVVVDGGNIKLQTSGGSYADKLIVDPAGRVTMPYQPSFAAYDNRGGATVSASGNISQYFTNAPHNVGGHYATSGANVGRFTAPVAGRYLFGWNFFPYTTAVDTASRMGITVNGNGGSYPGMIQGEYLAYTSEGTLLVHLNANDYVRWETQTSANVYWYNSDPRHNRIWGYFLG